MRSQVQKFKVIQWLGWVAVAGSVMLAKIAVAEPVTFSSEALMLLSYPLNPALLQPGAILPGGVTTAATISQDGLTTPSLWWIDQQFGDKLLDTWITFPLTEDMPPRVELVVNEQVWTLYNYVERYTFLTHFGSVAREYGYITRVFNRRGQMLGAYTCNFEAIASSAPVIQPNCNVFLDSGGQSGLTGNPINSTRGF